MSNYFLILRKYKDFRKLKFWRILTKTILNYLNGNILYDIFLKKILRWQYIGSTQARRS